MTVPAPPIQFGTIDSVVERRFSALPEGVTPVPA
jgi:hypothetical protein